MLLILTAINTEMPIAINKKKKMSKGCLMEKNMNVHKYS
jgi:hypothetical protein